eukprot:TRINITY_DN1726_c5_g1_i1.p1 TRINITY_DN1726_c5_g1~~TRINITY_DN1726_c5_g1_i1.p1  ORF type:complete len:626 (+),score=123.59 TRINITY_DN1726_c5_g1_i1:178-2055(+)
MRRTNALVAAAILTVTVASAQSGGAGYSLVRSDVQCSSADESLLDPSQPLGVATAAACAALCSAHPGCRFFTFGKVGVLGDKYGKCYYEKTSSSECTEGFAADSADFYSLNDGVSVVPPTPSPTASTRVLSAVVSGADKESELLLALSRRLKVQPGQLAVLRKVSDTLCVKVASNSLDGCRSVVNVWFSVNGLTEGEKISLEALLLRPGTSEDAELVGVLLAPIVVVPQPFGGGGPLQAPSPSSLYRVVPTWAHVTAAVCGCVALLSCVTALMGRRSVESKASLQLLPFVAATVVCASVFGVWLLGAGLTYRPEYEEDDGRWRGCADGTKLVVWFLLMGAISLGLSVAVAVPYATLWLRKTGDGSAGLRIAARAAALLAAATAAWVVYGSVLVWGAETGDGCKSISGAAVCTGCGELRHLGSVYLLVLYAGIGAYAVFVAAALSRSRVANCAAAAYAKLPERGDLCPPLRVLAFVGGGVAGVWLLAAGEHYKDDYDEPNGRYRGCNKADDLPQSFRVLGSLALTAALFLPCCTRTRIDTSALLRCWLCVSTALCAAVFGVYVYFNVVVWTADDGDGCGAAINATEQTCPGCGELRSQGRLLLIVSYAASAAVLCCGLCRTALLSM